MVSQKTSHAVALAICMIVVFGIGWVLYTCPCFASLWKRQFIKDALMDNLSNNMHNSTKATIFDKLAVFAKSKAPQVLLVSYDGFRWDYINHADTPNLHWLMTNGAHATEGLENIFITITVPNHWTLVTGVYAETHGLIANEFFSPNLNESFAYYTTESKTDPRFFQNSKPIWVANDEVNDGSYRATSCIGWVGCDVPFQGHHIAYNESWTLSVPWEVRVDRLVKLMADEVHPTNLAVLYIEEPDEIGHKFGPHSNNTLDVVKKLDKLTGYLLWQMYKAKLLGKVNMIFTADHGMADVPLENAIPLGNYVNKSDYTLYGGGPNWNILPGEGKEKEVYEKWRSVPHMKEYEKKDIPERFHYQHADGIMPIQLLADLHYYFDAVGAHGYDNELSEMHPIFVTFGPLFKSNFNVSGLKNLDVFPLMCYMLGIDNCPPNNGSFDRIRSILKDNGERWETAEQAAKVKNDHSFADAVVKSIIAENPSNLVDGTPKHHYPPPEGHHHLGNRGLIYSSLTSLDFDFVVMGLMAALVFIWFVALIRFANEHHHRRERALQILSENENDFYNDLIVPGDTYEIEMGDEDDAPRYTDFVAPPPYGESRESSKEPPPLIQL